MISRACAPARERGAANFAAWRITTFGGDFDPVAAIVDEAAALTLKDEFSKGRIYDAVDYDYRRRKDRNKIESALRRLNTKDRAFAHAVPRGRTRLDFGLSRPAFCNKLKKCAIASKPL